MRLDFNVESLGDAEQAHQHLGERDLGERLVEDRFADRPYGGLELVDARILRHPAGVEMQLGDPVVVALEEREAVLGQVLLVLRVQCADDAEIDGRILLV